MSKNGFRIEMTIGLLLMGLAFILRRFTPLDGLMYYAMVIAAVILIMVGIFHIFRTMGKNSRLRQWKLRLIGKEPK